LLAEFLSSREIVANFILLEVDLVVPDKKPNNPIDDCSARLEISMWPPSANKQGEVCMTKLV
jgi:hypothetical protein